MGKKLFRNVTRLYANGAFHVLRCIFGGWWSSSTWCLHIHSFVRLWENEFLPFSPTAAAVPRAACTKSKHFRSNCRVKTWRKTATFIFYPSISFWDCLHFLFLSRLESSLSLQKKTNYTWNSLPINLARLGWSRSSTSTPHKVLNLPERFIKAKDFILRLEKNYSFKLLPRCTRDTGLFNY